MPRPATPGRLPRRSASPPARPPPAPAPTTPRTAQPPRPPTASTWIAGRSSWCNRAIKCPVATARLRVQITPNVRREPVGRQRLPTRKIRRTLKHKPLPRDTRDADLKRTPGLPRDGQPRRVEARKNREHLRRIQVTGQIAAADPGVERMWTGRRVRRAEVDGCGPITDLVCSSPRRDHLSNKPFVSVPG